MRRGDTGIVTLGEFITVLIVGEFNFEIIGLDPTLVVYFGVGEMKIFIRSELKFCVNYSLG